MNPGISVHLISNQSVKREPGQASGMVHVGNGSCLVSGYNASSCTV